LLPIGFLVLFAAVAGAKGLRNMGSVEQFIARHPGTVASASARAHPGLPLWVGVQHFYSFGDGPDEGIYYDAHPIEQMSYHLTMLAYDMNGEPLTFGHGAPLRLRNETQLGFKQVKWIKGVEFVADFSDIGGGYGGYNQDHEFFGYRQSI